MSHSGELITREMLPEIYKEIAEKVQALETNKDAIEETRAKGYESCGYRYQYIVDILNEVLGSNHWTLEVEEIYGRVPETSGNRHNVVLKTIFTIGNWMPGSVDGTTASFFEVLDRKEHYGDGINKGLGDAYKGAVTNGIKKTLGLAGIGNRAFTGKLGRAFGKPIDFSDDGFEPEDSTSKTSKSVPKSTDLNKLRTAYYDPTKPYANRKCHRNGMPLDDGQMDFAIKNKIRPCSLAVLNGLNNDLTSVKLTPEELEYAKNQK